MAWDVNTIYGFQRWLINKNQAGGITSQDFFFAWNSEQSQYQGDLLGRWQNRSNGKTGANIGLIEDETIMTKLAPFTNNIFITVTSGQALKPSNYTYGLALRINNAKVYQVNHDQKYAVLEDVIDPPSILNDSYYFLEYLNYFEILPNAATPLELDYIASAQDIVWAYTFDNNNRQVYNPSGITAVPLIYGGVGYGSATITFSAPAAGGVQAQGAVQVTGGVITAITMTNVGTGYAGLTPTATIVGVSSTPAVIGSPTISVQPMWGSQGDIIEITKRSLKSLGVHFTSTDFEQFGASVINTGD